MRSFMSVHTKTHHAKAPKRRRTTTKKEEATGIPWREVAKENIEKYGEAGVAVKGARAKSGLTQKQLADELGILPHHISAMEHGKRPISKKMARKLGSILNISYKVFL